MLYQQTTAGKYLNSENAIAGKVKGNGFPYEVFEESVLMFLKDHITLTDRDTSATTKAREALEAELNAAQVRLKRTQSTMASTDDDEVYASLVEVLAHSTKQVKSLALSLEHAKAAECFDPRQDLTETKTFLEKYYEAINARDYMGRIMDAVKSESEVEPTPEIDEVEAGIRARLWGDFRNQIKAKLRQLITEIWVQIRRDGWRQKTALAEIHFREGGKSACEIRIDHAYTGDTTLTPMIGLDLKYLRFKHSTRD